MATDTAIPPVDGLAILKTLPLKIRNFCREYIIDFNGKQAAIRAGYPPRSAVVKACQLLTEANVQSAMQALAKQQADKLDLTAERTMTEAARVGYFDPRKLFHADGKPKKPHEWDDNTAAGVESYNWKKGEVKCHSKTAALLLCSRITKIVDNDVVSPQFQGNFVVICPADSAPEQWEKLAVAQMKKAPKQLTVVSGNGHLPVHARNGDTE